MEDVKVIYLIGQLLGFVSPVLAVISYQMRSQKKLLMWQVVTSVVMCLHYFMIGAVTGAALNTLSIVRNTVFFKRKLRGDMGKVIPLVFTGITIVVGILTWKAWYTIFYFLGMVIHCFCLSFSNSQSVRKSMLVTCPLVIVYDVFEDSYGTIVYEVLAIGSSIVGIIRHRNKNTE